MHTSSWRYFLLFAQISLQIQNKGYKAENEVLLVSTELRGAYWQLDTMSGRTNIQTLSFKQKLVHISKQHNL